MIDISKLKITRLLKFAKEILESYKELEAGKVSEQCFTNQVKETIKEVIE